MNMNKTLAITAVVLVAVVMGMSAVAPMIPPAFAHDLPPTASAKAHEICNIVPSPLPQNAFNRICVH